MRLPELPMSRAAHVPSGSRGRIRQVGVCALPAALLLWSITAAAEPVTARTPTGASKAGTTYAVQHFTIDGGGGWSTGGAFTIEGTIGQPDANPLQPSSGGVYTITGGFWPAAANAVEDRPELIFADSFEA